MSRALYEIDNEILSILENGFVVDEDTGEVLDGAEQIERLQIERSAKWESIALFLKNEEQLIGDIASEVASLEERKAQHKKKVDRIKSYLSASMQAAGQEKFETATCAISFRSSKGVVITDEGKLADKFFTEKVTRSPSLTAISKAITAGEAVEGAFIETRRKVQIK